MKVNMNVPQKILHKSLLASVTAKITKKAESCVHVNTPKFWKILVSIGSKCLPMQRPFSTKVFHSEFRITL